LWVVVREGVRKKPETSKAKIEAEALRLAVTVITEILVARIVTRI